MDQSVGVHELEARKRRLINGLKTERRRQARLERRNRPRHVDFNEQADLMTELINFLELQK